MTKVHWLNPVSADFNTAADWSTGVVPGGADAAILDAAGSHFTVTASTNQKVSSFQTASNATLAITGGTFTASRGTGTGANFGSITIGNARLMVGGTLMNSGLIALTGSSVFRQHPSNLVIQGSVILDGGGTLALSDNKSLSIIKGKTTSAVLTNVNNTISGSGVIGFKAPLTVINEAGGVIDANDARPTTVLELYGDRPSTNAGVMEATGGGGLDVVNTTVDNMGGTLQATGSGTVTVSFGTITGGEVFADAGSLVEFESSTKVSGAVLSTAHGGEIEIVAYSQVTTGGVIANAGVIHLGGAGSDSDNLILDSNTSLTGGGTVSLVNPQDTLEGTSGAVVLTNVDNTIVGNGEIGNGSLALVNQAAGVVDASGGTLNINTGTNTISNAGLMEATGLDTAVVASPVANRGTLEADGGTMTFDGAVTGSGKAVIDGGTLDFVSSFNQNVTFSGTSSGKLELAQSQDYTATVHGFSTTGASSLDLRDIEFVSPGEATFSGSATGGTLTVTDGTRTALINLQGDYLGASFTASDDGNAGTSVVASTPALAAVHRFVGAAAALGAGPMGYVGLADQAWRAHPLVLAGPRAVTA